MRASKICSVFFGVIGTVLAALVLTLCLLGRGAEPEILMEPDGAVLCARSMMTKLCAGDYAGASAYLYGRPQLDSGKGRETETGDQIWEAFTSSMEYELVGRCHATTGGIAQRVRLRSLAVPSITGGLKERAQNLLEARVNQAEDMAQVYDENYDYREDFVLAVLHDATADAIAQDGQYTEQELTLNLVYDRNQWWIVPDQALLNAISGGVLE